MTVGPAPEVSGAEPGCCRGCDVVLRVVPDVNRAVGISTCKVAADGLRGSRLTDDRDFVTRMIVEALSGADED
ncbi:hypothetical protein GCM10010359_03380 [Streptomyces morookaense]|nr:hypothetical protein GCM10010359_03380 [Streptomyces morookaense]